MRPRPTPTCARARRWPLARGHAAGGGSGAAAVLVTGGTGLLGIPMVEELRHAGFRVRVPTRRAPRFGVRVPGVEYVVADLARPLDLRA